MKKVYLKKNEELRILNGHLWVFSNEITETEGDPENGDLVEVYSAKKKNIGAGFYNRNSLIAVRLINSKYPEDINSLLRLKILNAYKLRKELYPQRESFRMVFSESDYLPGLIIDKYNSTFVLQINSSGIERNIGGIVSILTEEFKAENIFTKQDPYFRSLEGLPAEDKIYLGEMKEEFIDDGRIRYKIDFLKGQKTGFFFDQVDNRFFVEKFSRGKTCIDAFCNSGGFGLHALAAGSASMDFVDSSSTEVESVKYNYSLNGLTAPVNYFEADVFELFTHKISNNENYDVVMVDPPAFTRGRKNLPQAKKGYEKLNRLALELVKDKGYLVSSSCSFHLDKGSFLDIITRAGEKTGRELQLIHFNQASLDHPQLPYMVETSYLKFGVFKVSKI